MTGRTLFERMSDAQRIDLAMTPEAVAAAPLRIDPVSMVIKGLDAKIKDAVRLAWIEGKDFAHSPPELVKPNMFSTASLFAADNWKYTAQVVGGPIERGAAVNHEWTVYRCPDMTDAERARFADGRHDWRDGDWQDHCGVPGCAECEKGPTVL